MLDHRFREFMNQPETPLAVVPAVGAFVACPVSAVQQLQAAWLYQVAWEQAHAQVSTQRSSRIEFSLN
jgi:hypothetical protein